MQIVFDNIIFSLQKAGGISVVWYEILRRIIPSKNTDCRFIEFENAEKNIFRKILAIDPDRLSLKKSRLIRISRYFNPKIKSTEKFIFHSSYYRFCNNPYAINITTVHDFTYEKYFKGLSKWIHCQQKYRAIRHSDYIVCVSENTKKDLIQFLPDIDRNKIRVIHNGVSDQYAVLTGKQDDHLKYPAGTYLLYVGSRDVYKRFDLAVEVAKKFNFKLVIVGGGQLNKKETAEINQHLGSENYIQIHRIENEELNRYYNNAFCLMYTSEYEGFGIPLIEAQKAGCPVIAYNGSSITEIAEDSSCLVNQLTMDEICQHIILLQDKEKRQEIIKKGLINAERFSWDKTFQQYLNLYFEIQQSNN